MLSIEYCIICDTPTGRAGIYDDSLGLCIRDEYGIEKEYFPLCEDCYNKMIRNANSIIIE